MVAIAEKVEIKNVSNSNFWTQEFYDNLDSTETLLNDWKLIQESEEQYNPNNCMSAEEAYSKIKNYINNLK